MALSDPVIGQVPEAFIDVWIMQADGARAVVEGVNPYLPIYPNIHGPDSPYSGPGLVVDGELTIGVPNPPLSLLLVVPGAPARRSAVRASRGDRRHGPAHGGRAVGPDSGGAALLHLFTAWFSHHRFRFPCSPMTPARSSVQG